MADGWFEIGARTGDRTLEQQLTGLDPLLAQVSGKWILDVGCAEGLISIEFAKRGAEQVDGIEIVPGHIDVANKLAVGLPCRFEVADASRYAPRFRYDIVLMLAVLHKLKNPSVACARMTEACKDLCVIRLPPERAPVIVDARSGNVPHDIESVMSLCGFELEQVTRGAFDEWCGYFRRAQPD